MLQLSSSNKRKPSAENLTFILLIIQFGAKNVVVLDFLSSYLCVPGDGEKAFSKGILDLWSQTAFILDPISICGYSKTEKISELILASNFSKKGL